MEKTNYSTIIENVKSGKDLIELLDIPDGAYEHTSWDIWVKDNLIDKVVDINTFAKNLNHNYPKIFGGIWGSWFDEEYCDKCERVNGVCYCDENNDKCRFFPKMKTSPYGTKLIKMWLESTRFN